MRFSLLVGLPVDRSVRTLLVRLYSVQRAYYTPFHHGRL